MALGDQLQGCHQLSRVKVRARTVNGPLLLILSMEAFYLSCFKRLKIFKEQHFPLPTSAPAPCVPKQDCFVPTLGLDLGPMVHSPDHLTSPYTNFVMQKAQLLVPISKIRVSKRKLFCVVN